MVPAACDVGVPSAGTDADVVEAVANDALEGVIGARVSVGVMALLSLEGGVAGIDERCGAARLE